MALIRGTAVLHSVRYVRETFSPADHERVLRDLPRERSRTFYSPVREASWEPVEDLVAYMECAKARLAPNDPGFFRAMGEMFVSWT